MDILNEINKIPKIDKQISKIFEKIVLNFGEGREFTKKDLINIINQNDLLKNIKVSYNIYHDSDDQIYDFDINRKKRGRPSKNQNNKIILSENINVDNILWKNIYEYKNKDLKKYWRYHFKNNSSVIINQGLIINDKFYDKGIVVEKNFEDNKTMDDFIKKNIDNKIKYGYKKN